MILTQPLIIEIKDDKYRRSMDSKFSKFTFTNNQIVSKKENDLGFINKITDNLLVITWKNGENYTRYYYENSNEEPEHTKLINLLEKAEKLSAKSQGGYSKEFLSTAEFHQALFDSINKFKQGDKSQIDKLYIWFLPTSCWDDIFGKNGEDLGNEISAILSKLIKE